MVTCLWREYLLRHYPPNISTCQDIFKPYPLTDQYNFGVGYPYSLSIHIKAFIHPTQNIFHNILLKQRTSFPLVSKKLALCLHSHPLEIWWICNVNCLCVSSFNCSLCVVMWIKNYPMLIWGSTRIFAFKPLTVAHVSWAKLWDYINNKCLNGCIHQITRKQL